MNKIIKLLTGIFILQLFITLMFFYSSGVMTTPPEKPLLISFSKDEINKIILGGPGNKEVVLEKIDELWTLPNKDNFPSNQAQVNQLLNRLTETRLETKISQQNSSHDRLKVSGSVFERKVELFTKDVSKLIYFGSSPSLRQSHARLAESNDVYVVKFSANDIDMQPNDWLKKDIFTIPNQDIQSVSFGKIVIERVSDEAKLQSSTNSQDSGDDSIEGKPNVLWAVNGLKNSKFSNDAAIDLINKIADMRINGIASQKTIEDINTSKKMSQYTVTLTNNEKIIFKLAELKSEEDFLLFTSQRKGSFRLPPLAGKDLINVSTIKYLVGGPIKNVND